MRRIAIEEIQQRAKEKMEKLGYKNYNQVSRYLNLKAGQTVLINANSEYWYVREDLFGVDIVSDYGITGQELITFNELVYVHTGNITIRNNTNQDVVAEFIQVLPII